MVRRKPYSVVLFDEIEKAHGDIFNILLQILEDGQLTDSKGRKVDFKNTIIIMTSNVGARGVENPSPFGFAVNDNDEARRYEKIKDVVNDELKKTFRPEFLNRLDDIIIFHQLTRDEIRQIVDIMAKDLMNRIKLNKMELIITDEVKDQLAKEGYSPSYGARPLRRVIQKRLEDRISEEMLLGRFKEGDVIRAEILENEITFNVVESKPVEDAKPAAPAAEGGEPTPA
jgi:ATP-dependent Clp protease ATP-binding subunit ClpC